MDKDVNDGKNSNGTLCALCYPDPAVPATGYRLEKQSDPCTIVIFGATGDLTYRKLVPALFNLYRNRGLPSAYSIVGCGRTPLGDPGFRTNMERALETAGILDRDTWPDFAATLHYRQVEYDDPGTFRDLADSLAKLDRESNTGGNRIFYLALPPSLYKTVAAMIGEVGLSREGENGKGWARLVVEKPFGRDLESAVDLNKGIQQYFKEHQLFRIDHYLAKETVQNLLMFRFANSIFEPVWNRRYVDSIRINATETLGVEHRAGYYEHAGVIRDMFQNHIMQLLALTALEPPSKFEAEQVLDEKVKVYRALRSFPVDSLQDYLVLGQYDKGEINGRNVPAYRQEPGVRMDSSTPTYAKMKVFLDNWRWQGVPFYLTSGKRLAEKRSEVDIHFKAVPHSMFRNILGETIMANRLILGIYPEERITLTFQTKNPGARLCLRSVTMDFNYLQDYHGPNLDAYEKVLMDCMIGDHMLFWRQDGVEHCWSFLTPILEACEACSDPGRMLHFYPAGSSGPVASENL